ncbi:MAG: hypothetical protein FWC50_00910 [Planctomycetaceae bacterium]|nr:hypothetical protein [Planctomycetaceae bacterium]
MSNESTSPALKWILIAVIGASFLVAVFFVLLATYPANDYRVARELESRGFRVFYRWHDSLIWQYPTHVSGVDQSITPDDCRLVCQLSRLQSWDFVRCDVLGLNLDEIGNCRELSSFNCVDVTQFSAGEIRKLAACPVTRVMLQNAHLNDSDLEHFVGLSKLGLLMLEGNAGITDAGLEHLEKISSLKNLTLPQTSVTKEGVEEFQKKRPDVKVWFE